jgi:signal transduction histidine kinase
MPTLGSWQRPVSALGGSLERLRRGFWALPLTLAGVMLAIGINEMAYRNASASLASLQRRSEALKQTHTLLSKVLDAESGQRGYLLTGRPGYLEPYRGTVDDVAQSLRALALHYQDDDAVRGIVQALANRIDEKLSELKTTLDLYDQGREEAWRELMLSNIGKEKMDAVREAATALLDIESGRIVNEREHVMRTLRLSRIGIHVLALFGLVALFLYLRLVRRVDDVRHRHAEELLAERDRLERVVGERTAELTELARHLQTAREDERSHLARELHDELGALLTAAKIDTARLKRSLGDVASPAIAERLEHLGATLNSGIALKRRIIEDLRPSSLSNLGLKAALEIQVREFELRCEARVQPTLQAVSLSDSAQITVFRLVQEAMTNIAKYARASQVQLSVVCEGPTVRVAVRDDGVGFDPRTTGRGSHGLTGMRYRVEAEGGRLRVESAPGRGTLIEAWLPVRAAPT